MDDTPQKPLQLTSRPHAHPRRPPAHRSVSLRHTSPNKSAGEEESIAHSTQANPPSSPPSKCGANKASSGESSNAERWFERNNNNPNSEPPNFLDNDPPFFLRNSSSGDSPPDRNPILPPPGIVLSRPGAIAMSNTANSSSEDFRSVIDDLTVENKRLKKKLRQYEKLHSAHLHEDKLFEIRIHGLPPDKKSELEEYLKKFSLGLENSPITADNTTNTGSSGVGYESTRPSLHPRQTKSSYTSHITDSAYASLSASGRNSATMSGHDANSQKQPRSLSSQQQRQENIHNYLQDIPEGLLPKQSAQLSDKAKKKLVVRRLEQIFAGKGAAVGGHQQPIQQQEIAQSAARADRTALEATGQLARQEGHREARFLPIMNDSAGIDTDAMDTDTEATVDLAPNKNLQPPSQNTQALQKVDTHDFANPSGNESPDQRPTRPLDLDPYRAQVPADNIEYIRHLGFSPMDPGASSPIDDHGWIYTNVLTNMAQLHTVNVTPDFVQIAVHEYSKKLELSKDGRKIRWKGGNEVSRNSSDDGTPDNAGRLLNLGSREGSKQPSHSTSIISGESKAQGRLPYVPLFAHKDSETDLESSSNEASYESSPKRDHVAASSGFNSSGIIGSGSRKRRNDNGPIIFYNKARFITDLSGNRRVQPYRPGSSAQYQVMPTNPIGTSRADYSSADTDAMEDVRGPLSNASPTTSDEADISSTPSDHDIIFMPSSLSNSRSSVEQLKPIEFEASGIGGVRPQDNFAIDVRSKHVTTLDDESKVKTVTHSFSKSYPKQIQEILHPVEAGISSKDQVRRLSQSQPVIAEQIISSKRRDLPVSTLPEASYLAFDCLEEDEDEDDDEGSDSDDQLSTVSHPGPMTAPQPISMLRSSDYGSSSDSDVDEDDDDEDESVDFLAAVRKTHPSTIQAQEREYDANIADRLAEEIPAGSSAATAGGGSGFNSPMNIETGATERKSGGPSLKRVRTSDSPVVHGKVPKVE